MSFRLIDVIRFGCFSALGCWSTLAVAGEVLQQTPEVMPSREVSAPVASPTNTPKKVDIFAAGDTAKWVWGTDDNKNYTLRKKFTTKLKTGKVKFTADNASTLFVNGKEIASSDAWETAVEADISKHLKVGENTLEAKVVNQGGLAGYICKVVLADDDTTAKPEYVVTDDSWVALESPEAATGKAVRVVGTHGDGPWGKVFNNASSIGATENPNVFNVPAGFQVEKLFTVPKDKLGSWVSITFDNKGRLIASDQEGKGLCRITIPAPGASGDVKVEQLDLKISAAQGMLYAFDALYLSVNGGPGSGLYKATDTNGDDQFDKVEKLATINGGGEHGPHALRLTPDGKSILLACGNHTRPPEMLAASRVPTNWNEDHLLPRNWDGNGHARGILAPGGWIAKIDPEGKTWEIMSSGYRNEYDFDLNAEGEIFAYDADMEWDYGTPWYRPTRVNHATSGSELGWRSGTGKWPSYYIDSLPALADIGPGSPVGVTFGYGAKFPAKYQKALFICDWTFGTMYAIHLSPTGSTYSGVKEEFLSRTPLPLTDNAVGPDGALYFTVGGRGTQSELYRVVYKGKESTDKVDAKDAEFAELRELRKKLEGYHHRADDAGTAVELVYPHLFHHDRFIRYAARIALEHQKPESWQDRVLRETNVQAVLEGTVALARQGDKALQEKLLAGLLKIDFAAISETEQLDYLRALSLVFIRMGEPSKETAAKFIEKLDGRFPTRNNWVNRELSSMLIYLGSPTIVDKALAEIAKPSPPLNTVEMNELLARNKGYGGTVAQVLANAADPQKFHYLFVLRNAKVGWKPESRQAWFSFLNETRTKSGGASFANFLRDVEKDFFDNSTDADRLAIEALGLRKPFVIKELPKPKGPGKEYTIDDVLLGAETKMKGGRNFENGKAMFAAARCVVCHRFFGDGGATGPDLSQAAGRFQLRDLAEAIIDPSKVISDQYKASTVITDDGKQFTGKIVSETKESLLIVTNPEDSTKVETIIKSGIEEIRPSPVSLMPKDLLKELNENEVMDLMAYLLSRGDQNNPVFKK